MLMSKVFWVFVKDFKEIIRNRRALMSMVVVPALIIPLIIGATGYFTVKALAQEEEAAAVAPAPELAPFAEALKAKGFSVFQAEEPGAVVEAGAAQVGLGWEEGPVLYYSEFVALAKAQAAVDSVSEELFARELARLGLPDWLLNLRRPRLVRVRSKGTGFSLGLILGYIIVLFIFVGGMYPAADTTAGERERRTLEILLAAPVDRWQITAGKTLAVFAAALITAAANILYYTLSASFLLGSLPDVSEVLGLPSVSLSSLALLGLAVFPFALFASAALVAVASFAKSYMEAQTYLSPLLVVVIIPALASMVPSSGFWAWTLPVYSTAVAIRDIITGSASGLQVALTFGANCLYAAAGVLAAALALGREGIVSS